MLILGQVSDTSEQMIPAMKLSIILTTAAMALATTQVKVTYAMHY